MATKTAEAENGEVDLQTAYRLVQEHEQQERQVRVDAFLQEYRALCQKYGLELTPGMSLREVKS